MSIITNITRDCIRDLQMLNEYIEMTYPEFDQVWLMDKVATAMAYVRTVEDVLLSTECKESEE